MTVPEEEEVQLVLLKTILPKSKPVLIGNLYRPPDKYDYVNCLERTFTDLNV